MSMDIRRNAARCLGFAAIGLLFAGCTTIAPPPAPLLSTTITQLDFGRPGQKIYLPASDWGRLRIDFRGAEDVRYLNLSVNDRWVIQNLRVHSVEGGGMEQSITVPFGLGNPRGQRVSSVDYGISLTAEVLAAAPPAQARIDVRADTLDELCTGGDGADGVPPPPDRVAGGEKDPAETRHANTGFVNQDTVVRGCVQAGFSNSLQWLKKNNPSLDGVKDEDISLEALATAVGSTEANGAPDGFIAKKRDYLAAKNIPIDTIEIGVADVGARMDQKCDVEMWTQGAVKHFVAVVGISKGKDGKYSIDVAHDTKQGEAGGTLTETITYDPAADKISGGAWLHDAKVLSFVVECPRK